ncbi:hypothetical protein [Actinomadura sp. KC216]|nr:hypothetical protein [Actinomadura sp. KC216]
MGGADAAFPGNAASVEVLDSPHSPFLSMPDQDADVLARLD